MWVSDVGSGACTLKLAGPVSEDPCDEWDVCVETARLAVPTMLLSPAAPPASPQLLLLPPPTTPLPSPGELLDDPSITSDKLFAVWFDTIGSRRGGTKGAFYSQRGLRSGKTTTTTLSLDILLIADGQKRNLVFSPSNQFWTQKEGSLRYWWLLSLFLGSVYRLLHNALAHGIEVLKASNTICERCDVRAFGWWVVFFLKTWKRRVYIIGVKICLPWCFPLFFEVFWLLDCCVLSW